MNFQKIFVHIIYLQQPAFIMIPNPVIFISAAELTYFVFNFVSYFLINHEIVNAVETVFFTAFSA